MKRVGIRKNNRGDSLILVIGCIALLSVLGIIILAKSVDNQTMKISERNAQESFFKADSTSAELATVLETVALDAIEDAFSDMLVEYSESGDDAARKLRYKQYFETRLSQKLTMSSGTELYDLLVAAVPSGGLTDVSVEYDGIEMDAGETGKTDIIKVKNVKLTYSANGSKTTVTTDINIQTQIPDVTGGFRSTVDCNFSDFAVISDGTVVLNNVAGATVNGNLYTGNALQASGSSSTGTPYTLSIQDASKVLVKGSMQVDGGALININYGTVPTGVNPGIWANDIYVQGGGENPSMLTTSNMNVYVSDDMTVDGENTKITMSGAQAQYVGYSGGISTSGLANYKKSSAITINKASKLVLDLDALKQVVLTGTSYIHETDWDEYDVSGNLISEVPGVMQGESLAYKDMQAMYLVPSECMAAGHNPVMDAEPTNAIFEGDLTNASYMLGAVEIKWADYLDNTEPVVERVLQLDAGATEATYVYLNFKNETMAAQYIKHYLNSAKGDSIKQHAKNLGSSSCIELPTATYARGNVFTYNGTNATVRSATDASGLSTLSSSSLMARLSYYGLFSSLEEGAGSTLNPNYKMVAEGITSLSGVSGSGEVDRVDDVLHPVTNTPLAFYLYKGNLVIDGSSDYRVMNGILLVNGNVTIATPNVNIKGLVLATGTVTISEGATFTADPEAVETLLADERVAKYFKGFAESEQNYLSSEAVDIVFDNWKRNVDGE